MEKQVEEFFELCKREGLGIKLAHKNKVSEITELINGFTYSLSNEKLVIVDLDNQNQYIFDLKKYIISSEDYLEYNSIYKIIMENSVFDEQFHLSVVD